MSASEMLDKIGGSLGRTATVRSVFGDPIHAQGKTVVPVARVLCGFGAGFGSGPRRHSEAVSINGEGGGGGGGMKAVPAGVLEISETRTRFVPFHSGAAMAGAFAAGIFVGAVILGRRFGLHRG